MKKLSLWAAELEPELGPVSSYCRQKDEVEGATENIGWAVGAIDGKILEGGTAAEQANCIWLISSSEKK